MPFDQIKSILMELLDLEEAQIESESYLVRDLNVESIDFLELAVALNDQFQVHVHDDTVFLRKLRLHLAEAGEAGRPPAVWACLGHAVISCIEGQFELTGTRGPPTALALGPVPARAGFGPAHDTLSPFPLVLRSARVAASTDRAAAVEYDVIPRSKAHKWTRNDCTPSMTCWHGRVTSGWS